MSKNLVDKALIEIKSKLSSAKTTINDDLFHYISNAIEISPFVADVFIRQSELTLNQVSWHSSNQALNFSEYLSLQIKEDLFKASLELDSSTVTRGQTFAISDFVADYQSEDSIMKWLRNIRYQHSAAIAVLELNGLLSIEESMARMSVLAEELILAAYLWSYATKQEVFGLPVLDTEEDLNNGDRVQNMLILAMGKLGGHELNFSSDIDLIFFYSHDGQTSGGRKQVENSRFFQKVGASLIKLLNEPTEDGFVFRVDMRLRPYGSSGNLVMSIDQAEDYYHEQGRGWERFAMVRARVISGREQEKTELENIITPFAFRRYIDYGVIDSLRNMKEMIQREVRRRGLKDNIKLGAGGIREIEFMVQSLQLIQGGRDKRIQEKSLLKVLPLLSEVKLLVKDIAQELANNYRFLRRLENFLQQREEQQTQQLPQNSNEQYSIAKLMGFSSWKKFYQKLETVQLNTNEHFSNLFSEEKKPFEQEDDFYMSLWEGHISVIDFQNRISNLNEQSSQKYIDILKDFRRSRSILNLSNKGSKRLQKFFPNLLKICLETHDPVKTILNLIVVLKSILQRTAYLDLLSENPPILQHFVDLVSRSEWMVRRLSDYPILFDELLYPNSLYEPLKIVDLKSELQQALLRIEESDEEQMLNAIRRFKQANELRVGAALLSKQLNISQVGHYLSELAEVVIQAVLEQSWRVLTNQYGVPENLSMSDVCGQQHTGFSVIAYGKLGGAELGFNSDLDLVFLFEQPLDSQTLGSESTRKKSISVSRFYTRLAQKMIHFLSTRTNLGLLYEVDMRLRPSGNSGLLVSHIDAFAEYQKESAWTWEHQALVRARAIAGDLNIMNKFAKIRLETLRLTRELVKLKQDIVEMRDKMRKELKTNATKLDLKHAQGGLIDIEFLAQYFILSLSHGDSNGVDTKTEQELIPSDTIGALSAAKINQQLSNEDADLLIRAYQCFQNTINERFIHSDIVYLDEALFASERCEVSKIWKKVFS